MAQGYKCVVNGINVRPLSDMSAPVAMMKRDDRVWGDASVINGLPRVVINKIYRANGVVDVWENCTVAVQDGSTVLLQKIPDLEPVPTPDPDPVGDYPVEAIITMASGKKHKATDFTEIPNA